MIARVAVAATLWAGVAGTGIVAREGDPSGAPAGAAAPAVPGPVPNVGYAPAPPPPEMEKEFRRLERVADAWSEELRQRHGLASAQCSIQTPPIPRSACTFGVDGISLIVWKEGRAPTRSPGAYFRIANEWMIQGRQIVVVGAEWIRIGDVFEIATGRTVYAYRCDAIDIDNNVGAICNRAPDFASIAARASFARARYGFTSGTADADIGRAAADGTLRILHNGREVDTGPLRSAAQEFARTDFNAVAAQ